MESIAKRRQTLAIALLSSIFALPQFLPLPLQPFPARLIRHPSLCCYRAVSIVQNISGHKSKIHAPNDIRWWRWRWNIVPIDDLLFLIWFSSNYYVTHISIHHNEPHAIRIGMTQLNDRNKSRIIMAKSIRPFCFAICKEYKNSWWPYIASSSCIALGNTSVSSFWFIYLYE